MTNSNVVSIEKAASTREIKVGYGVHVFHPMQGVPLDEHDGIFIAQVVEVKENGSIVVIFDGFDFDDGEGCPLLPGETPEYFTFAAGDYEIICDGRGEIETLDIIERRNRIEFRSTVVSENNIRKFE